MPLNPTKAHVISRKGFIARDYNDLTYPKKHLREIMQDYEKLGALYLGWVPHIRDAQGRLVPAVSQS